MTFLECVLALVLDLLDVISVLRLTLSVADTVAVSGLWRRTLFHASLDESTRV